MSSTWSTDEEYDKLAAELRPRLTGEFLATLIDAAGLSLSDPVEVDAFVREVFHLAGKTIPDQ